MFSRDQAQLSTPHLFADLPHICRGPIHIHDVFIVTLFRAMRRREKLPFALLRIKKIPSYLRSEKNAPELHYIDRKRSRARVRLLIPLIG